MEARPRLLDQMRNQLRTLHYSYRTEQQYLFWVRRFILFHGKRHPADMSATQIEAFLTHLAVDRQVSASTQNQALAALRFLYQKVLRVELPWLDGIVRAKLSRHLPVVLTSGEVNAARSRRVTRARRRSDALSADRVGVGEFPAGGGQRLRDAGATARLERSDRADARTCCGQP